MTNEEAKKMLKAKLECFKNEISGINHDCNMRLCDGCSLNYEQGNVGEQKEALDMAIQALEQQPCEDCISRQAVKDMLTAEWTKYMPMEMDVNLSFVLDKISALPSVTPKTGWIPVTERLPEDIGGEYLVNIEYKGEYEGIDIAEYQIGGYMDGLWITPNDWIEGPAERWHVTAWMPLPAPYKESEEEK